jgi:hypothetical protein
MSEHDPTVPAPDPAVDQPVPAESEERNEDQPKYDGGEIPPASPEQVERVREEQGQSDEPDAS